MMPTSLFSHKYPGNHSAHGRFLRPTSCLYATLSPIINLHRVPLYLISLTKLTILHGMSVLKVCCSRTRGTLDSYFWYAVAIPCSLLTEMRIIYRTPGVGYTRWHISFPIAMLQSCHTASTIIGLATISVTRIYNTLPSCGFMGPCGVVTAWGRSKRHGARICFPLAHYIDFWNYLAYMLYSQIFHVADILAGDCAIRSPVSDYAVQNDDLMRIVAIKGLHSCSPRPAFHARFLESHLRPLSYC
ncbi:hypothetical protein V8E53_008811 [Lactarius tabidus]